MTTTNANDLLEVHLADLCHQHISTALQEIQDQLTKAKVNGAWAETHWLDRFAKPSGITGAAIREHKRAWQISYLRGRPYDAIAKAVRAHLARPIANPADPQDIAADVEALAVAIGRAADPLRLKRHRSWASKIATHGRPDARVFMFDQHAGRAVRFWARRNVPLPLRRGWAGRGPYAAFASACDAILQQIMGQPWFEDALKALSGTIAALPRSAGRLADPAFRARMGDFLARRLADKFLFHQGAAIAAWRKERRNARLAARTK